MTLVIRSHTYTHTPKVKPSPLDLRLVRRDAHRCSVQDLTPLFILLSIQQTEDVKQIALKMSLLPKVNECRPRIVVITHGKEPAIVVKGKAN